MTTPVTNARSKHEIFELDYQPHNYGSQPFRKWWASKWYEQIDMCARLGWAMIPIAVRGKLPLRAEPNYDSHGAAGPYLSVDEAKTWVGNDFNLAVAAGPSKILWCDLDDPNLFKPFLLSGLVMRTPRGFAFPLKLDETKTTRKIHALQKEGFDFREQIAYELVPLSETCTFDHELHGQRHPGPREPCIEGHPHQYKVREWITPTTNPLLSFRDLLEFK